MYYGGAEVKDFRLDLPVLYIRAGLDRPRVNREISEIATAAILQSAPITVVNYSGGHHAFEMMDDNDATREVLEQTFHFLHSVLTPRYQTALHANITEASATGAVVVRDFPKAASLYSSLISQGNTEPRMILAYGEALVGAHRYKDARAQFDRLRPMKVLGPRDLGLPAAAACALDGDPVAAIDWLKTIPKRFLPRSLLVDETFASLRDRPDFQALFQ